MNRRESLRILTGAIGASMWGGGFAAAVGDLVGWADVTLLDGRMLPATALERRVVVVETWASWCPLCARQNTYFQEL